MNEQIEWTEEWSVRHSQGTHPGPFTEKQAREWIADDIKRDGKRQLRARGRQALFRRYVTKWEEVPLTTRSGPDAGATQKGSDRG